MKRFMPQTVFDAVVILRVLQIHRDEPDSLDRFSDVLSQYMHSYNGETKELLVGDVFKVLPFALERVDKLCTDLAPFYNAPPDRTAKFFCSKMILAQLVQTDKAELPLWRRILGGTRFNYEKALLVDRVEVSKRKISEAASSVFVIRSLGLQDK